MKLFFFDTETTGLNSDDQILQFGGIFGSFDGENFYEEYRINQFINVSKEISPEAERVHGISKDKVKHFGYIDQYIDEILMYIKKADYIVGHNLDFDVKMVRQECNRIGKSFDWSKIKQFCTMKNSIDIVNLPGKKRPKLAELYRFLFNKNFDNAHDAMADIEATKDCFIELMKTNKINIGENNYTNENIKSHEDDYCEDTNPLDFYMNIKNIKEIEHTDTEGKTILMYACEIQKRDVVKYLLENGANPNRQQYLTGEEFPTGKTALIVASSYGNGDIVKILLENGADIENKGYNGHKVLMITNSNGYAVEVLLKETALIAASSNGHGNVVGILLKAGADIENKDNDGDTALIAASSNGHGNIVRMLLKAGADTENKGYSGNTALIMASAYGYRDIVEMLLKAGADIENKGYKSNTALMLASSGGHRDIVETLLKAGADIENKGYNGNTALIFAISEGEGNKDIVERLLKAGADIENKDNRGDTALMVASSNGHKDTVEILLKYGADIENKNNNGSTALIFASFNGHRDIVEILLKAGADIENKDNDGITALMAARSHGHRDIVETLLKYHT